MVVPPLVVQTDDEVLVLVLVLVSVLAKVVGVPEAAETFAPVVAPKAMESQHSG